MRPAIRWTAVLSLVFLLASCRSGRTGSVSRDVATASFCLHAKFLPSGSIFSLAFSSYLNELIPALEGDAQLYEQAGDPEMAKALRELASGLGADRRNQPSTVDLAVFLLDTVSEAQKSDLEELLRSLPEVQSVTFESKEQAYERAKEIFFKDQPDLFDNVARDAFPASFRVKLIDPATIPEVTERLQGEPGVSAVRSQELSPENRFTLDAAQTEAVANLRRQAPCPDLTP